MKKLLLGFLLFTFLISCGNKKAKMDPFATITEMVDSAGHKADTLLEAEVKEEPKPMEADELFDDFIFNYARMMPCKGRGRYFLCPITIVTRRQR